MAEFSIWDSPEDFVDGCETVTFLRRGRPPGVELNGAFRRSVRPTRMDRRYGWAGTDAVWHIPEGRLPGPVRPGDVLRDSQGRRWTVLVASATAAARLILWTRDWAASFSSAQLADIEVAHTSKGPAGEPVVHWRPYLVSVPVQFHSSHAEMASQAGAATVYRVLVAAELPPVTFRIKTQEGAIYHVEKVERAALPGHPTVVYVRGQQQSQA